MISTKINELVILPEKKIKQQSISKEKILNLIEKSETYINFKLNYKKEYDFAIKKGWGQELYEFSEKIQWEKNKEIRTFNAFLGTKEFQKEFEKFKLTYKDIMF